MTRYWGGIGGGGGSHKTHFLTNSLYSSKNMGGGVARTPRPPCSAVRPCHLHTSTDVDFKIASCHTYICLCSGGEDVLLDVREPSAISAYSRSFGMRLCALGPCVEGG